MNSRALTLAISLLASAAAAVALTTATGCGYPPPCGGWEEPRDLVLGVDVDLHAVSQPYADLGVAVGAEGTIVVWGFDLTAHNGRFVNVYSIGPAALRALLVEDDSLWVVGDGGTAAISGDLGETWTPITMPTSSHLHAIVRVGSQLVVAGDEVVLTQAADGSWIEVAAPADGWGQLRALYFHEGRLYAVGLGGVIWSTGDPGGEWTRESSGTSADLFAVNHLYFKGSETVLAVGAGGTFLMRKTGGWDQIRTGEDVDFVDYENGRALAADGTLFKVDYRAKLERITTLPGVRAIVAHTEGVVAVGPDGAAFEVEQWFCTSSYEEGRPFVVDGRTHTASLRRASTPLPELARTWARDGLYEHASVASFARFALELLALGAPPRLLLDVQAAIHDEIRHARVCFDLARRFGGVEVGPGPMPIPANAFTRVGDPIATAIALFDEACLNESVAACEAAERADRSDDPEVRRVLEDIAADERRHAVAGWAALRWMLDTFGDQIRGPLRARLARLRPGPSELHDAASCSRRVIGELVQPLAHAMLHAGRLTCTPER